MDKLEMNGLNKNLPLSRDLLTGAEEIARFIFGAKATRKRAYGAIERGLPVFRIGSRIYARRSVLHSWMCEQEKKSDTHFPSLPNIPR